MENSSNEQCRNCGFLLPADARFCPNCSQRNSLGKLSAGEIFREFIDTLLNLDSRIMNTLRALAVPGKLTQDYFRGKHVRYYHPVRLFMVSAGLFTTMLVLKMGGLNVKVNGDSTGFEWKKEMHLKHGLVQQLDSIKIQAASEFENPVATQALDTMQIRFERLQNPPQELDISMNDTSFSMKRQRDLSRFDSVSINHNFSFGDKDYRVAIEDLENLSQDELLEKYQIKGYWNRLYFRQMARIEKSGTDFAFYLIGNTIWMMLVMMPMLALVLKLLYIRRRYFYHEHLLFSFHTHTFVFLFYSLVLAVGDWLPDAVVGLSFVGIAVYLYFAMKRFYGQHWFKTLLKFFAVNILYFFIALFALLLTVAVSAVVF